MIAAFSLRIWGITFDLPHVSHPDEPNEVHRALRLGAGNFEIERVGKGGYYFLLFFEYGLLFIVLKIFGNISTIKDFMLYFFNDPTYFYIIGRTTTVLVGTLNVWLTYLIGKKVKGENVGLISALFMAFSNLNVLHAHYITVDVPMTACVLATAYFALRIYENGKLKNFIFASFFLALSIMTKIASAPIVFVIGLAHYFNYKNHAHKTLINRNLWAFIIVTLLIYFAGEPGALLKIIDFLKGYLNEDLATFAEQKEKVSVGIIFLISFYLSATLEALGWPLFLVVLFGIVYTLYRPTQYGILLILFPFILCLFLIFHPKADFLYNRRYILPALPFLYIIGAQFIHFLFDRARQSIKLPQYVLFIFVIVLCIPQALLIVKQNTAFVKPGTNIMARNWIEQNIPDGSKILLEGYRGASQERGVPLQDKAENMNKYADEIEEESPMGALYVRMKTAAQEGKEYDLVVFRHASPWASLEKAKQMGVQYVIFDLDIFTKIKAKRSGSKPKDVITSRTEFYDDLAKDPEVRMLKSFHPPYKDYKDDASRRNNPLEIYQIYQ